MEDLCQVSLLTPPGRGAVATVAVCGADAVQRVAARFSPAAGRPLDQLPTGRILFGRWRADEGPHEELVVCHSQGRVEIHCHGGQAAPQAVIQSLVRDGCQCVGWEELLEQTAADPLAVEAHVALARARTQRTAAILLDQLAGNLRSAWDGIAAALAAAQVTQARAGLDRLLARADLGLHLSEPFRVVLSGPPNAGKSSLTNALLGYRRSIVFDQPGTTRDVVTAHTAIDGWPVELADTAGLRTPQERLERVGIDLARERLTSADLVLLVFDASQDWEESSEELVRELPQALLVQNKCDLPARREFRRPAGLRTSAATRAGLDRLLQTIGQRLVPDVPPPGAAVPFTLRQQTLLQQSRAALEAGDLLHARQLLLASEVRAAEQVPRSAAPV